MARIAQRETVIGFQPRGVIECLRCGKTRTPFGDRILAECPGCGYLGWADSAALDDIERRLRDDRQHPSRSSGRGYASFAERPPPTGETGQTR